MADLPLTSNISALTASAGLGATGAKSPEQLRALAAQFESLLMGQLLREMQQSMFESDSDDKSGGVGMGMGPLADTLFAEFNLALSRSGGMGLAASLMDPLMKQAGIDDASAATGSEPAVATLAAGSLEAPAAYAAMPGRLTSGYGWRPDPIGGAMQFHRGLDLAMPIGQDVPVARQGTVTFTGELPGYGLTVVVKHDERASTRYAHLSEILVNPGDQVAAGATIARSGATGRVTGPHLHVEVLDGGQPVDPSAIKVLRRVAD
jgi:murein DD-endopeptidase MepM/ murein hydrolase activator NlpD